MKRSLQQVNALTFDVFGTVVDWRGRIIRELQVGRQKWPETIACGRRSPINCWL